MVDGITTGGAAAAGIAATAMTRAAPAAPAAPATPVATPTPTPSPAAEPQLAALAKAVAASAPVDTDRVAQIKSALANGTFPILPATIADQMMAFRYEWMSHEPRS